MDGDVHSAFKIFDYLPTLFGIPYCCDLDCRENNGFVSYRGRSWSGKLREEVICM